ncbi:DUF748 domain-containing protein [Dyadobacter chenwenxiniae]|uniref:DUF748 domain-containing protein n=1 Tax=Dyadobacter chenwenxiniae TaxID=2906456 RepID=A0A9X1PLW1_9BACT|nr:DUF748 domain-containing protein [Dyadobacter chenwenxiniae]MCF0063263.1 DUF748 domain-containing protein [Dyadobacter chenwenxiniae]UON85356.1 DUF748 domain-containing protein [Dyadobacter chenwenxiniae]
MPTSKRKKVTWIIAGVLLLMIAVRIALPYIVLHYANKSLAEMKGYYGHIQDVDLAVLRGAYRVDSIYLNKADTVSGKQTPFFAASVIDLSIEWKALLKGSIAGNVRVEKPLLVFTKDKVEPKQIARDSADFKKILNDFMPLSINRCEIRNGTVRYKDPSTAPKVDIHMDSLHLLAQNLRNSYDSSALLPASVDASARIYEGTLTMNAKLNPLADQPTFDMSAELKNTNLVKLNEFFQAYAKIDVNKGRFGLYTEVAAKNNRFAGYVKPLIKDLDVLGKEDRKDNVFRKLWEAAAGGVGQLLRNQPKDQVATKIPFEGKLDDPETNIWYALSHILQNAFIHAIQPSIDSEISIASVDDPKKEKKTFLQKIFSGDKKEKKEKKEKK